MMSMVLTKEQSKSVSESWAEMEPNAEIHGVQLFKYFFEDAPETKKLFSFLEGDEENAEEDPKITRHAGTVFELLGNTVAQLTTRGRMEILTPLVPSLGTRHFCYGVQPEHFAIMGKALMKTLEDAYGDKLTPELRAAWTHAFNEVCKMMKKGLRVGASSKIMQMMHRKFKVPDQNGASDSTLKM